MSKIKLGDTDIPFVFRGDELMYPNYVKGGLVLHYDFTGMTNDDTSRGIATDLSGNGNHGELQNFNYTAESGYDKNKLLFDGVDDQVLIEGGNDLSEFTILMTLGTSSEATQFFNYTSIQATYMRKLNTSLQVSILSRSRGQVTISAPNIFRDVEVSHINVGFISNGSKVGIISNGVIVREIEIDDVVPFKLRYLGRWTTHNSALDGFYNSVQVYNRPLTPEEIAHNYAIEKERFSIE